MIASMCDTASEMHMDKRIVIVGGGPAGIEAALTAAHAPSNVTIISAHPLASWHKLMPSRVWLTALDTLDAARSLGLRSIPSSPQAFDFAHMTAYSEHIAQAWNAQHVQLLQSSGVTMLIGHATLLSPHRLRVIAPDGRTTDISADVLIIATGTSAHVPGFLAPDGLRVFSPDTLDRLRALPRTLLLIGDGPIGFEFAHLFNQLQIEVTWLVPADGPRCRVIPEADHFLTTILTRRGVRIIAAAPLTGLERRADSITALLPTNQSYAADMAFVAFGSQQAIEPLNLEAAGRSRTPQGGVRVNAYGQTDVATVYLVGDALQPGAANVAMAQARVAALHASGQVVAPHQWMSMITTFHSNPQIAKVGVLTSDDPTLQSVTLPFRACLKPSIAGYPEGQFTLAWNQQRQVVGGLAMGYQAADALTPVAVAIKLQGTIDDFTTLYGPHPTISELVFIAARRSVNQ
jgi:pyruvate/2-oxoglutarate dehydrogenase complex dihydrolipoamide dehydrogenase (E3) component